MIRRILPVAFLAFFVGCQPADSIDALFTQLDNKKIGIDFQNNLAYDKDFNVFNYRNFYNGGGVAVGDVNNDGWMDLYFTANQTSNALYLNNGDMTFTDITESAGVAGQQAWSTGVAMADVNQDGFIDIYVSNSGDIKGDSRANELFLNNGDNTFTEVAEEWGVADQGLSTHGVFFDYDRDGDLDLYVLNNSYRAIGSFNLEKSSREVRDAEGGDKLYRNDGGSFTDVSEAAGIMGSEIGFGLGTTVGDVNGDGWDDIYISNDFFEKDYLYINNQDGTFSEELEKHMRHTSFASMGADMADINNDGAPDIFVTDMLPQGVRRLNQTTTFENWDVYQGKLKWGYYHQFNRNMLHLNTTEGDFSEIGQLSGVEATDWSWGALIADLDNDGWRDIYISNGINHDLTDQDYINYISNEEVMRSIVTKEGVNYKELIDLMPSTRIPNYAYKNVAKGYKFVNKAEDWGLDAPSHSNGSVYADLDND
ncbi:MAG: VCBS repeat-containing protein, partial [Flavobacteriales bacterium]